WVLGFGFWVLGFGFYLEFHLYLLILTWVLTFRGITTAEEKVFSRMSRRDAARRRVEPDKNAGSVFEQRLRCPEGVSLRMRRILRIAPGPSGKRFCRGHPRSGRLCLPDSAGAGPGRLPALLGLPSGRTKSPLTLTWPFSGRL
ncbi:hypothetical protein, partial [Duffyella sp. Ts4]|uniref:hypothetical protein n=1 Tax=Duffyella sp. Ts4 TaxID=3402768 RepID=UPI003F72A0B2